MDLIQTGPELQELIEDGNRNAFTSFYACHFQKLILVAERYVKNVHVAEEIVQEIFLKIWEKKVEIYHVDAIKPYLYKSVINASINYVKRQKNIDRHHEIIFEQSKTEDSELLEEQDELIVFLYQEIDLLPAKCQVVFKMSRLEGMKYKDIALALGLSENTVENHIANAFRILRKRVLEHMRKNPSFKRIKNLSFLSCILY